MWQRKLAIVMVFLAIIFSIVAYCNAAESAIVSFDDPEHLAALTDSVVGVCDTNYVNVSVWNELGVDSFRVDITCRRLVSVVKIYPPIHSLWVPQKVGWSVDNEELRMQKLVMKILGIPGNPPEFAGTIPGQAIIFYEEVKQ